jgi:hypothetical protein
MDPGATVLRITPSDEFLQVVGITPPVGLPDGSTITLTNEIVFAYSLVNNSALAPVGTRILFRATVDSLFVILGSGGLGGGGCALNLQYRLGVGWYPIWPINPP